MRSLNAPNAPVLTADRLVETRCTMCGKPVTVNVPAGCRESLAEMLLRNGVACEFCAAADEALETQRAREQARLDAARAAGLPRTLQGLTWDSYSVERRGAASALSAARAWSARTAAKPGLVLTGGVGVGKTRLAATALWDALLQRDDRRWIRFCRWVSVPELIMSIGAGFGDADRARALKVLTGRGPLVLDDLDKVTPSTWVLSNLFTAVDRRVQSGAPMIVTTNLAPDLLVAKFTGPGRDAQDRAVAAEAIVSRLVGHCEVRGIDGPDGRQQ